MSKPLNPFWCLFQQTNDDTEDPKMTFRLQAQNFNYVYNRAVLIQERNPDLILAIRKQVNPCEKGEVRFWSEMHMTFLTLWRSSGPGDIGPLGEPGVPGEQWPF